MKQGHEGWLGGVLLLLGIVVSCFGSHTEQPKPPFRIALLVAWIGNGHIPASSRYFFSSVAANSNLLDLLLFHENNDYLNRVIRGDSYPNVKVYDLGEKGFSKLAAASMGSKLELHSEDITELTELMATVYRAQSKWSLEIRPAFGTIFESYMSGYTHWLYMDVDEILGDFPAWLEMEELTDFHIVTLATGDSHRVYMRGPFTLFNRTHEFPSLIWRRCGYLSAENIMDYFRFKAANCLSGKNIPGARWRCGLIPDEAEFSERVIMTPDIRLKIASKSLADPLANLLTDIRPETIFWVDGAVRFCTNEEESCDPTRPSPFRRRMLNLEHHSSISMPLSIDPAFPGMRIRKGERQRVLMPRKDGGACKMKWTLPWGRCLRTSSRRFDLYLIDRFWWKQEFAFPEEEQQSAVSERMIVHFRSWKHRWSRLGQNKIPLPPSHGGGRYVFTGRSIRSLDNVINTST